MKIIELQSLRKQMSLDVREPVFWVCDQDNQIKSQGSYRQVWVKDFSRTSPASPTVFKDLKLMKNTDLSVKFHFRNAKRDNGDIIHVLEN